MPDSLAFQVVPGGRLWLHVDARDAIGTPSDTLVRFTVLTFRVESYTACGITRDGRAYCIPYRANGENPPGALGAPWILAGQD